MSELKTPDAADCRRALALLGLAGDAATLFAPAPHLFGADVAGIGVSIAALGEHFVALPPVLLPSALVRASRNRQLAFAAGRLGAACTLLSQGADPDWLARDPDGAPIWPPGFCGSITHTRDWAFVVSAPADLGWRLGVDSEDLISPAVVREIMSVCMTQAERQRPRAREPWDATVLFCAKEAYYKAVHARVRRFVEFDEVEVYLEPIVAHAFEGALSVRPCSKDGDLPNGSGRYCRSRGGAHVAMTIHD